MPKNPSNPTPLEQSGMTPRQLDRAVAEAADERGLSRGEAELLAQEAWAEYDPE